MAKLAGIKIEKIVKGKPAVVRIDLRKHLEFIPLLEEKGIFKKESPYDPKFVAKIKKGKQDIKNGKGVAIKLEDLWKDSKTKEPNAETRKAIKKDTDNRKNL